MSLLLIAPNRNMEDWEKALLKQDPNLDVHVWPDVPSEERVQFAVCWDHPPRLLNKYPNLKTVSSLGAGVDHILSDDSLPFDVKITRVVSPSLVHQMKEYVLNAVLNYQRNTLTYMNQKVRTEWKPHPYTAPKDCRIGVMGLGTLGRPTAEMLGGMGYTVSGWSGTPKTIAGVQVYSGREEFNDFLQQSQILVCMLPLTAQTRGILDLEVFKTVRRPGYLVNVARGEHLVEEDLIYALDKGWLKGVCLDVFTEEPLPERHPFWNRHNILITPHVSSLTQPDEAARQILENYKRTLSGMELLYEVSREKGY